MVREKDPRVRQQLLERATDHVVKHGLPDLSLRPLGDAIGSSARMLIYHFGSKEALIAAVLERATSLQQEALREAMRARTFPKAGDFITWFWAQLTSPELRPLLQLLFEVDALGLRRNEVYASFSQAALETWRNLLDDLLTQLHGQPPSEGLSTLLVGTVNGLLLDLLVTGDEARVNKAFRAFMDALEKEDGDGR